MNFERPGCPIRRADRGTASVEQLVILATVAIAFAAAMLSLGPALLDYHSGIEFILSLPIP
jgi:hypothetical protein